MMRIREAGRKIPARYVSRPTELHMTRRFTVVLSFLTIPGAIKSFEHSNTVILGREYQAILG